MMTQAKILFNEMMTRSDVGNLYLVSIVECKFSKRCIIPTSTLHFNFSLNAARDCETETKAI